MKSECEIMHKGKFSDLCSIIGGGTPKTSVPEYWDGDIPWLSVKDFCGDRKFVYSTEKSITQAGLNNSSTKLLREGDIIVSARGTVGELAMLGKTMAFNQSCFGLRAKEGIDQHYLYYLTLTKINELKKLSHGCVFDTITRETFDKVSCAVPPLPIQRKRASILSALDDKIETNNAICRNLEELAMALFKARLVASAPLGLGEVSHEKLLGWRIGSVDDVVEFLDSRRVPLSKSQREKMERKYPYYGATELMDYVDNYLFDGVFLLLGEDGTVQDEYGYPILQYVWGKFWVNNHAHVLTGKGRWSIELLYLLFANTKVSSVVTGAVQPKISQNRLKTIPVVIPPDPILENLSSLIAPLFAKMRQFNEENHRLVSMRDALLPKLMCGEIDLSTII